MDNSDTPLSGYSNNYYVAYVSRPTNGAQAPYLVECNDIIEALEMTFAEGNVLKAVWRHAMARRGQGKPGGSPLYDAEKIIFFGERLVAIDNGA